MPTFVLGPASPKLEDCSLVLFEKTKEESNRHAYSREPQAASLVLARAWRFGTKRGTEFLFILEALAI
jgi:hypothetical protein